MKMITDLKFIKIWLTMIEFNRYFVNSIWNFNSYLNQFIPYDIIYFTIKNGIYTSLI